MEIWKSIISLDGKYEVSNYGRVKSLNDPKRERILKPYPNSKGYLRVRIARIQVTIHRLVARHFLENDEQLPHINHLNDDKADNRASNLQWCTAKENNDLALANGRRRSIRYPERYVAMRVARNDGMTYAAIAKKFNISNSNAYEVLNYRARRYGLNRRSPHSRENEIVILLWAEQSSDDCCHA